MDERIGVHDLDGAGRWEGVLDPTATGFGRSEGQDGAEAFPAGEDRVSHALMHGFGAGGDAGEEFVEGVINEALLAFEVSFEIGHGGESNRNRR